ncbi:TetR/AcrR family transcriptional regulator C-terminal domain-containing protein [Streptomyces sp. PTM05]|uniref:TetR/AcrR family transcriptional regulator C-terminal domain-containing protein n=1 Tax=Streptantibioticus parmotrematis TaxID=2873249 RepID=A0ABS7QTE4_9ACTN|nr:TetR/AcrR family transcriptional regulator C-terminal domain-containing protein [Streptantibioticus parmotrematis]MBY8886461.1 TetR/AcrR family transcriptional regulator C-terminal domain-containing protein [Streptantibioticus parmotrematis]
MTDRSSRRPRAPRGTLNRDRVLAAAVDLLDHAGPDAFTMRALAQRLGVGTMAVYSHFQGKDEIIDAVRDLLFAEVELPPADARRPPHAELRELCRAVYRLLSEHPSVLHLLATRPVQGDEGTLFAERALGLLRRAGLDGPAAARAYTAVMQYTVGAALWTARGRKVRAAQGCDDPAERLRSRFAGLPPDRYPCLTGLAPQLAAAQDGMPQYEHGLDALLTGLLGDPDGRG